MAAASDRAASGTRAVPVELLAEPVAPDTAAWEVAALALDTPAVLPVDTLALAVSDISARMSDTAGR